MKLANKLESFACLQIKIQINLEMEWTKLIGISAGGLDNSGTIQQTCRRDDRPAFPWFDHAAAPERTASPPKRNVLSQPPFEPGHFQSKLIHTGLGWHFTDCELIEVVWCDVR